MGLLLQFVLMLVFSAALAAVVLPIARTYTGDTRILIAQVAGFGGILISVYLARRYLDKRSFASLGLQPSKRTWPDLLFGFLLGGAVMGVIFGIEWAAGWLVSPSFAWQQGTFPLLVMALLYYVMVGFQEEILARGYWLQNLAETMKTPWAIVLTSVFFALGHLGNEGANALAVLSLIGAGLLLAYGWLRSGRLWLPIGLHIGWNFFESALGFPVSGLEGFHLLTHTVRGPEALVGGAFGPESGLLSFLAMALAAVAIFLWTRERAPR